MDNNHGADDYNTGARMDGMGRNSIGWFSPLGRRMNRNTPEFNRWDIPRVVHTYISILRGVNLGGRNSIKMAALRELLLANGFQSVETYIQSGNIVYQHAATNPVELSARIKDLIQNAFGFEVPVITLTASALQTIVAGNPFPENKDLDPATLHVTFLAEKPQVADVEKLEAGNYRPDAFEIADAAVYLHCPEGYGNTKLSNKFLEGKLQTTATTRNWKTTLALLEIAERVKAL